MSPMAGDRWDRKRLWRFAATKWKVIALLCCVATLLFVLMGTVSPFSGVSSEQCEGAAVMDAPWTPLHTESQSPKLSDLVVHRRNKAGEVVKVLFVVASSKIESSVCRNVASAYMSGCPVVLVGFDTKLDSRNRMKYALSAAKEAGLSGKDVIVLMDSVTMFTGMDPFKFIDRFIDKSPATADALKAADVRNGTAMAPFYVAAQEWCSSSMSSLNNGDPCKSMWRSLKKMFSTYYANVLLEQKNYAYNVNIFNESKYATQYIDSGVTVSRLWTMEAVNEEFHRVIRQHEEDARVSGVVAVINSQVVLQLLYFNHLLDELPFQTTEQHVVGANRMAMGTVDLDYFQHICSLRWGHQNLVELHTRLWGEPNNNSHVDTHDRLSLGKDWFYNCTSHAQLAQFIRQSVDSKKLPSKELHFSVGNKQYSSRVVPPVFSRQYQADVGYVYPFLRHYPFDDASRQMDNDGIFMAWGIPILVDAEARRNAHTMLRSVRIVTHSPEKSPSVRSHEYAENCGFPFKSWGLHPIDA